MRSVEMKWKAIGYPFDEMPPGIYPFDPEMPHKQRARAPDQAAEGRRAGRAQRPAQSSPEVQEIYFDVVARSAQTDAVDRPVTIQWKFADAEPWHIRIDNGSTGGVTGLAPDADVTLRRPGPTGSTSPCAAATSARPCSDAQAASRAARCASSHG